jgi:hypothetical protein
MKSSPLQYNFKCKFFTVTEKRSEEKRNSSAIINNLFEGRTREVFII